MDDGEAGTAPYLRDIHLTRLSHRLMSHILKLSIPIHHL